MFIHEWNEPSCLYSVSIHQTAPPERGSAHPITAHYPFMNFERMKGWVGLVGWHCSGQFTHISGQHPLRNQCTYHGVLATRSPYGALQMALHSWREDCLVRLSNVITTSMIHFALFFFSATKTDVKKSVYINSKNYKNDHSNKKLLEI